MKILKKNLLVVCLLVTTFTALSHNGYSASPWYVDPAGSGKPYTWGSGYLPWYSEQGGLGFLSNKDAIDIVNQAFGMWKDAGLIMPGLIKVPTSAVSPTQVGVVNQEIASIETMSQYIKSKTVIIFDNDGAIISKFANPTDVAAMTFIAQDKNDTALTLKTGVTILSGKFLEQADQSKLDTDPYMALFKATVIHELGHLFNLDHSALNQDLQGDVVADANLGKAIPTMYPIIVTPEQGKTLHMDDVVSISNLYPRPEFTEKFCTIAGKVIGSDGKGFQGAMVIARSKLDPLTGAVSAVTGINYPGPTEASPTWTADGSYFLRGITPVTKYTVEYGEINSEFTGGSSVGSWGDDEDESPRSGFGAGGITSGGGKLKEVACEKGGQMIVMDTLQLNVEAGGETPANSQVPAPPEPFASSDSGSGGKGCSLILPRAIDRAVLGR